MKDNHISEIDGVRTANWQESEAPNSTLADAFIAAFGFLRGAWRGARAAVANGRRTSTDASPAAAARLRTITMMRRINGVYCMVHCYNVTDAERAASIKALMTGTMEEGQAASLKVLLNRPGSVHQIEPVSPELNARLEATRRAANGLPPLSPAKRQRVPTIV